jgi:hypothetical protein
MRFAFGVATKSTIQNMEILMLDRIRSIVAAGAVRLKALDIAAAGWVAVHPRLTMSLAALSIVAAVML